MLLRLDIPCVIEVGYPVCYWCWISRVLLRLDIPCVIEVGYPVCY